MLEKINTPKDLQKLNTEELNLLAKDIREFLVKSVSKTGGHLAANLGVVELTIALFLEFDPYFDRIVWDVGHQAYVHKILTGRANDFESLRQFEGLSGFPKRAESGADAFNSGHSSTSVSAATGFAAAAKLKGTKERAIAVLGDGAMTGGIAFEGLNHAGSTKLPVIVILNDNGMAISKNVGGFSKRLENFRNTDKYLNLKSNVKNTLSRVPVIGSPATKVLTKIKATAKDVLVPGAFFENFGFKYIGPVDGHNIEDLRRAMRRAKTKNSPVLIHINTIKGMGYKPAEEKPDFFHGVSSFDDATGKPIGENNLSWSEVFGDTLCDIASKNKKVAAITAAMPQGTGLEKFAKKFPDRFFDVGIAEQHAVTFASGLAGSGVTPVVAVYSTFLQRAYDQIIHDTALMNLHTVFCIDRCGPVGSDGETHQGVFDIAYMSQMPNMTLLSPSNKNDFKDMLEFAVNTADGPIAVRYPRGDVEDTNFAPLDVTKTRLVRDGKDVLILAVGVTLYDALKCADLLGEKGISASVADVRCVKPIDKEFIFENALNKKLVVTVEDGIEIGGFGQQTECILGKEVLKFAYPDEPIVQGSISQIKQKYGTDYKTMAEKIEKRIIYAKAEA